MIKLDRKPVATDEEILAERPACFPKDVWIGYVRGYFDSKYDLDDIVESKPFCKECTPEYMAEMGIERCMKLSHHHTMALSSLQSKAAHGRR